MPKIDKKTESPTKDRLLAELADLRIRLQEAEETLEAIRSGSVDAVVVSGKAGDLNKGATFYFTLPRGNQNHKAIARQ